MNVYSVEQGQNVSKDLLRLIGLSIFLGNEFDIDSEGIRVETQFSLSNLSADSFTQIVYSSAHQNVIENFDKPIVEIKDIVVAAVPESKLADTTELYDNFVRLNGFFANQPVAGGAAGQTELVHCLIGVSNSSNTDFFEPFEGIDRVAFHADKVDLIIEKYNLESTDEWDDVLEQLMVAKSQAIK